MKTLFLSLGILSFSVDLHPISYGSNTAVLRLAANIFFPNTDSDNRIIGFSTVENGLTIQDNTTNVTLDVLYPIAESINLNDGNIFLKRDLVFSNTTRILALGTFLSNNHSIHIPSSLNNLTGSQGYSTTLSNTPRSVAWSGDNKYLAEVGTTGPEIDIVYFDDFSLTQTLTANTGAWCNSVAWPSNNNYFMVGLATGTGEVKGYYLNTSNGTLTNTQSLTITPTATIRAFAFTRTGSFVAIGRRGTTGPADEPGNGVATDQLAVCAYNSPGPGWATVLSTTGFSTPKGVTNDAMAWDPSGSYLAVGTDYSATAGIAEVLIYYFNGTTLTLTASIDTDGRARALDWSPTGTFIAVGIEGGTLNTNLRVYSYTISNGIVAQVSSVSQSLDVLSVRWSFDGKSLLAGTVPGGTPALATCTTYDFDRTKYVLSERDILLYTAEVRNVRWAQDSTRYSFSSTPSLLVRVVGGILNINNGALLIDGNMTINAKINFSGTCALIANNNTIDLNQTGLIKATPGTSLLLKNVTFKGVTNNSILCMDNVATITFDRVNLILTENLSFTTGHFDVISDLTISGSKSFIYSSSIQSSIQPKAKITFNPGSSFGYLPTTNQRNLISMVDKTSTLFFNGASLFSSATGLRITTGTMLIDGKMNIGSAAANTGEAITFGDGSSAATDVTIVLLPSAQISVTSGYVINENLS
jgi:hypothetical protein